MRLLIVGISFIFLFTSCTKDNNQKKNQGQTEDTFIDLSYGTDGKQKLDLYLPASRTDSTRLLIIIHGGGWTGGDKSDFNSYVDQFKQTLPDYAIANLNYRLASASGNYFPTQENDVKSAVKFLIDNSSKYVFSKEFVLLGVSAGAQLALLQTYKHTDIIKPLGVISYFGPTDLQYMYENSTNSIPWVLKVITNSLENNPNLLKEASPINYLTVSSAKTLLLHGDKDTIVPVQQAVMLEQKLASLNVSHELVIYPGEGHDLWSPGALLNSFGRVENFIKGL